MQDPLSWLLLAAVAGGALVALIFASRLPSLRAESRARGVAEAEPERVRLAAALSAAERERDAAAALAQGRERELATLHAQLESVREERAGLAVRLERMAVLGEQLRESTAQLDGVRAARERAEARCAELSARLEEQQHAAEARLGELRDARERMRLEFQSLASELLEAKAKRMTELGEQQLGQVLNPLREQLGEFRRLVGDVYEKENASRIALQSRIDELVKLNQTLGQEAHSLSRALSADNRSQGYWGELKLERLLESAGLQKGSEYLTQESFRDADGDLYRPDAVLKLPEGRDIIIDAKVALLDYQRACDASDDGERQQHLARHVAALRQHVKSLGGKDYSRLEGVNAPDLVLMFVPVEAAFLEALRFDDRLYDDAFQLKIVLVGPSNLLASLRLVAQIWRSDQQNRNARLIADRAGKLYDKFVAFTEDIDKVGKALDQAQKAQQAALGKLSQGKGNLVRQAELLRSLGVAPGKQLAAGLLDAADGEEAGPAAEG